MKETCQECVHSRWLVGIGQGFRCHCPSNKNKKFTEQQEEREFPVIPNREFLCEHFSVKKSKVVLEKLIFRLTDKVMDGEEIDEKLLSYYRELLSEVKEK